MRYAEFAAVYPQKIRFVRDDDSAVASYLAWVNLVESFFGMAMRQYLVGKSPAAQLAQEVLDAAILARQTDLIKGEFVRGVERTEAATEELRIRRLRSVGFMQLVWDEMELFAMLLLSNDNAGRHRAGRPTALPWIPTRSDWNYVRDLTALRSARLSEIQYNASHETDYYEKEQDSVRSFRYGLLSEFDTLVALQQMCSEHPSYVAVPAPPQFERARFSRNVDFLVLRPIDRQVIGIQVKTHVNNKDAERYDPKHVLLWDAEVDMEETELVRIHRLKSDRYQRPQPGLVVASAAHRIDFEAFARRGREFLPELASRAKRAKERTPDGTAMLNKAATRIYDRIHEKLGNPSEVSAGRTAELGSMPV